MKKLTAVLITLIICLSSVLSVSFISYAEEAEGFMTVRQATLNAEIKGNNIPKDAFWDQGADGKNENVRLTKSRVGISTAQMFRVTRTTAAQNSDNAQIRLATIYTDRKTSVNAEAYMYYMEIPEEISDPNVQYSWNIYDGDSTKQESGHIYNGTCYYLLEGSKSWVPTKISDLWFSLPTGFKGYVMFKPAEFNTVGSQFNKSWQLETTHIYMPNLNNQTVMVSAPFIVENPEQLSFAAYIGEDKSKLCDLFSGDTVDPADAVYKMTVGETVYTLPSGSAELDVKADDLTYLPAKVDIQWNAYDGAAAYSARLFKMNAGASKSYVFEKEETITDNKVTFKDLTENQRYTVIIYALDSNGKEMAISESFSIYAARGINFDKADAPAVSTTLIIIIAAAVLVIIAVVVIIIAVSKKKK